jgi:hypothetical protein
MKNTSAFPILGLQRYIPNSNCRSGSMFWLHRASWLLLAFQNLLVCSSYTEPLDFTGFTVSWFVPATQSLLVLLASKASKNPKAMCCQ